MEAMLGRLPGAEAFVVNGPPWWFGFHAVPGLAEQVLEGHEAEYLRWFFSVRAPNQQPIDPAAQTFSAAVSAPNCVYGRIKNCGHNIPEEQPDVLAHALIAYFGHYGYGPVKF